MEISNPLIAYFSVFAAGLISSFSPCVLITIPLVISYVGGFSEGNIKRSFAFSLVFAIGLAITFTILGAIASLAGTLLGDIGGYWKYILGMVAMVMGLQMLGILNFQIPTPKMVKTEQKGLIGAFLLGMLFGVASSPCSTPVLALILTFVASKQNLAYGTSLLFVYALAHTFLIFLIGISTGMAEFFLKLQHVQNASYHIHKISGLIFILIGLWTIFDFIY
ncbi:MAG: cytochrome c biogenesis protein CcdA [Candidatus Margulisbacteria bacterium]|nr:cytochrome c biogenesis protein CcdA [Candidatus Margulisiibacteriota bacterium]